MKKSAQLAEEESIAPAAAAVNDGTACLANDEGVFENPATVMIAGLPSGCAAELRLALSPEGWRTGFFLHSSHPRNSNNQLVRANSIPIFATRLEAEIWLVKKCVEPFFEGNKTAQAAVRAWWFSRSGGSKTTIADAPTTDSDGALEVDISRPVTRADLAPVFHFPGFARVPVAEIERNPANKRSDWSTVPELAESIRALGMLLHPVFLLELSTGGYRLIAGERRWRAHLELKWPTIDARVFAPGTAEELCREVALVENMQREDLNAMEEAEELDELRALFGYSSAKIAERTGKPVARVDRSSQLLLLPENAQELIRLGRFSANHGRALRARLWEEVPAVVLADLAAKLSVSSSGLGVDRHPVSVKLMGALAELGHAVEIGASEFAPAEGDEQVAHAEDGSVWHLAPRRWDEWVKSCKKAQRDAGRAEKERFAGRVSAQAGSGVNLQLADLERSGRAHLVLEGKWERFYHFIPPSCLREATTRAQGSVVVCLEPEKLKLLRAREAAAIAMDRAERLPEIMAQVSATAPGKHVDAASAYVEHLNETGVKIPVALLEFDEVAHAALMARVVTEVFGK